MRRCAGNCGHRTTCIIVTLYRLDWRESAQPGPSTQPRECIFSRPKSVWWPEVQTGLWLRSSDWFLYGQGMHQMHPSSAPAPRSWSPIITSDGDGEVVVGDSHDDVLVSSGARNAITLLEDSMQTGSMT